MELAPLQLTDYFVHSIRVDASPDFDSGKKTELDIESLKVEQSCVPDGGQEANRFALQMSISQDLVAGKNIPYSYEIQLIGFITAHPNFPKEKLQRAVEVNGPSMLFGAAREILRAATGRGPYGQVLIPSTTFFKPATPPQEEPAKPSRKYKAKLVAVRKTGKPKP
jgi:preprotein translocase subunit SecB